MQIATRATLAVAAAAVALAGAASARAAAACSATTKVQCAVVEVPLDRTGVVPGTIPLHVEVLPSATRPARGVMFLVAGGPGQGSASTFDLRSPEEAAFYRYLFPGYTLVAYDDRGTGRSGLLSCDSVFTNGSWDDAAGIAAACAAQLGPGSAFYSTADHAEDLDAVRRALGYDRVALWGVSYGTKLALAYAELHPENVERLLLDSVEPLDVADPFETAVLQALPATLARYCAGGSCGAATADYAGDVTALANGLAATPLAGAVRTVGGGKQQVRLGAVDFLGLVVDQDLSPGLAAELPAAVHAARTGDAQPLLRAYALDGGGTGTGGGLSWALYLATVCHDGPFPWQSDSAVGDRTALERAALAALPVGAFGPFGSWAADFGSADVCLGWPAQAPAASLGGALPDVPVLAVSGGLDLRTPTAGAAATVARFPHGRLLVVPGVGHSVLTMDPSGCSQRAVRSWLLGGATPATCARATSLVPTVGPLPAALPARLSATQVRTLVTRTLREAEATWLMAGSGRAAGLAGGTLRAADRSFTLDGYSAVPGLALTGKLRLAKAAAPLELTGVVRVRGRARGTLFFLRGRVLGPLRVQ